MSDLRHHRHHAGIIMRWLLLSILASSAIYACTPTGLIISPAVAQVPAAVQFSTVPCRFPLPKQQPVECGDLLVPENYADPDSRQIHLHGAVIKSSSDEPAPDPLIILYGGPGAHALDRLSDTVQRFDAVLAQRDIILLDLRGVGCSQPSLNCPALDDFNLVVIDEQLSPEPEFARRMIVYQECRDRLETEGISLPNYSAAAITADVASLRRALGYDEWNLYGVSHGARLALMIMRDYPFGLRAVVLDSAYPAESDLAQETAVTHAHALAALFAATRVKDPQFETKFFALVDQLDASPIAVPVADPRGQDWFFIKPFNGAELLQLAINLARWPQSFPHIPGLIDDIAAGDYRDLSQLLQPSVGDQLFSEGMNLSVNCQEIDPATKFPNKSTLSTIDPRVYDLAANDVQQKMALCKLWLGEEWPLTRQNPVISDIPTLLLRGEHEALIPPQWSEKAAAGLSESISLTFPQTGHGVIASNRCAQEIVAAFLHNPSIKPTANCQQ